MDIKSRVNPFIKIRSAAAIDWADLPKLFERSSLFSTVLNVRNQFIFGDKGAGKTAVLKMLSGRCLPSELGDETPFWGIYLSFGFPDGEFWRDVYRQSGASELFEYFFILEVAHELSESLRRFGVDPLVVSECLQAFARRTLEPVQMSVNSSLLKDPEVMWNWLASQRSEVTKHIKRYQTLSAKDFPFPLLSMSDLPNVVRDVQECLSHQRPFQKLRVALLIDGYDFLGILAGAFTPLLSQDYNRWMCVKIGALHFGEFIGPWVRNGKIFRNRDFDILPLRLDANEPKSAEFFRGLAAKAFRAEWGEDIDIDQVLKPFSENDMLSADELGEWQRYLLSPDSKKGRPKERWYNRFYSGPTCFRCLSAGNPFIFIQLMEKTLEEERDVANAMPDLSPLSQGRAAIDLAQEYVEENSGWLGTEYQYLLRSFLWNLLREMGSHFKKGRLNDSGVEIEDPENLDDTTKDVLSKAFRHGFLITTTQARIQMEFDQSFIPKWFRPAPILFPRFGLPWHVYNSSKGAST